jgi:monovalent cation:H+ antiporter-2, CPA2 family
VEDIAMVLILVMLPVLSETFLKESSYDFYDIFRTVVIVFAKIVAFVAIMMVFGKRLLPKLLVAISKTKSRELITLGTISISSGFAFIAYTIFGASFALGAFMAGFVLNESAIGRKSAEKSLPLRDIFAVLFFVSAGMLFNPKILLEEPLLILVAFFLVVFGKGFITYLIMKIFRQTSSNSLMLSASLAQIGEFSFILAALALKLEVFSPVVYDMVIASAILSIAINPFLFRVAKKGLAFRKSEAVS